jgi:hypothetical protein
MALFFYFVWRILKKFTILESGQNVDKLFKL